MWLAYAHERPAYNLTTAVENLAQHFSNLEFDAEHEAEYGFDRFYTYDECMEMARKYEKASEACSIYLHTSDLLAFLQTMKEMDLKQFLGEITKFVPQNIIQQVFEDNSET